MPIFLSGPLFAPKYHLSTESGEVVEVQLFPGYGRWNFDLVNALAMAGAPLPEAADAVISEVHIGAGGGVEFLLLAIEFCGALPAGNNAWQRCGRSYSYAITGVPYLYVSELGGYELTDTRKLKSARLPNPLVPLAYVSQSDLSDTFALPVYEPSPTIDPENLVRFGASFGLKESLTLIRAILIGASVEKPKSALREKGLAVAAEIAGGSRRAPSKQQWDYAASLKPVERVRYWASQRIAWRKSISMDITSTMTSLNQLVTQFAYGLGASDMPFAVIPDKHRRSFAAALGRLYPHLENSLISWIRNGDEPLILAMIAGFKPRGDDSRPDRGLLPLIRMLFGEQVEVLSVVYGPAKNSAWEKLVSNKQQLANENGLWNSVLSLSNAVLADARTLTKPIGLVVNRPSPASDLLEIDLTAAEEIPTFGEQDVDTVIRFLYATNPDQAFEGMCNPPGGDWSGVSLLSGDRATEFRWASLPRVSGHGGKRPDHVVQFFNDYGLPDEILSIESKRRFQDFEPDVGSNLSSYLNDLIAHPATISRDVAEGEWSHNSMNYDNKYSLLSAGAFIGEHSVENARQIAAEYNFDIILSVTFNEFQTSISLTHNRKGARVAAIMAEQGRGFQDWLKIDVHAF